jgi:hypothetical protein
MDDDDKIKYNDDTNSTNNNQRESKWMGNTSKAKVCVVI